MMALGFLIPLLFLGLLIFGIRKLVSSTKVRAGTTFTIREVFQYLILFGVLIVAGIGVSGLLGRLLHFNQVITENRTDLARNLTFTIIGAPLTYVMARWTSRSFHRNPSERDSLAWRGFLTASTITTLSIALSGIHDSLSWLIGNNPYNGNAIARAIVWSFAWIVIWRIARSMTESEAGSVHLVIGSVIGLSVLAVGIGGLIGNVIDSLILSGERSTIAESTSPVINSIINIAIGAPVWTHYWLRNLKNHHRSLIWYLNLFLSGIASGFITLVASLSVAIYLIAIWFFGDIGGKSGSEHFAAISQPLGSACIGLALWWYHRAVLGSSERSEVRRIYEYLISGVSLIAASLGLLMIFVAVLETLSPSNLVSTNSQSNTLIIAITLLIVGAPIWWFFWSRIQKRVSQGGEGQANEELLSPTRRIFILMLFGVAGIAAVISVITGVFLFFDDLLNSQLALETLRKSRFALGVLVTNSAISAYHWSIYRHERDILPAQRARRRKSVLLVGPHDGAIVHDLEKRIGARVQLWQTPEADQRVSDGQVWDLDAVEELVTSTPGDEIMIVNEKSKLRAIPYTRS